MDWWIVVAGALYVAAITVAVSNARDYDWGRRKIAGVATFLVGAGLALFVDDVAREIGADPALVGWLVPAGGAIMVLGIVLALTARMSGSAPF